MPGPELKNKAQLAEAAETLAQSYALVQRGALTYIPVDWVTLSPDPPPPPEQTIWLPLMRDGRLLLANQKQGILFANESELRSFEFMLKQFARDDDTLVEGVLVKTPNGLRMLDSFGRLVDVTGQFTPNYVRPMLNEDPMLKDYVFKTIATWLNSEEQAHSLLRHLATCLAPHYAAGKYILLLGEGRNGKGTLLSMLLALFGEENVSGVTRQLMAERSPACIELNGKLLNIVMDGEMAYIKDSSAEKTLLVGEPLWVRLLYESQTTKVQTNALFIEALNQEPKARDKSPALQKRLVRFQFPNVYKEDKKFLRYMLSEEVLGAFLSLLVDHYVREEDLATALAPTVDSMQLQLEQMWLASPVLQFLEYLAVNDQPALQKIAEGKTSVEQFLASFRPWMIDQGHADRSDGDLITMMKTSLVTGWKTQRVNGKPQNKPWIKGLRPETELVLTQLKGDDDAAEVDGDGAGEDPVDAMPELSGEAG